jgi:hypothetical protein
VRRPRYDANPDVDEALHYSGAGAAALKREHDAREAHFSEACREMWARTDAEWARAQREEMAALLAAVARLP